MPVTRSLAKSSSSSTLGTPVPPSDSKPVKGEARAGSVLAIFHDLQDDYPLQGRDAKLLRDATSSAISQVWDDTCATAAMLTRKINEGNTALKEKLNESFAAVGKRLDALPAVAMLQPDAQTPKVIPFSGATDTGVQFSIWLRRLEDIMRMRPVPLTDEQRANFLIGHLDGVAREKVEELDGDSKKSYSTIVSHLTAFFESPQQRYVARQKLSACHQEPGEPCTSFANRVLNLVRAATSGQDPFTQKERVLEEFVGRLRGDTRYFVKLDNPVSFEQAVAKAQMVEQLLSEATADRLLHPASAPASVQVASRSSRPGNYGSTQRSSFRSRTSPQPSGVRRIPAPQPRIANDFRCFTCHGYGHFANVCPSTRRSPSFYILDLSRI
ncbi:zinc knuckle [Cooperia oncophora]